LISPICAQKPLLPRIDAIYAVKRCAGSTAMVEFVVGHLNK